MNSTLVTTEFYVTPFHNFLGPLWVVVKFAENGSLLDYIRKHKNIPDYVNTKGDEPKGISNVEILRLAHGIAKGMSHLAKVKVRNYRNNICFLCLVGAYRL